MAVNLSALCAMIPSMRSDADSRGRVHPFRPLIAGAAVVLAGGFVNAVTGPVNLLGPALRTYPPVQVDGVGVAGAVPTPRVVDRCVQQAAAAPAHGRDRALRACRAEAGKPVGATPPGRVNRAGI